MYGTSEAKKQLDHIGEIIFNKLMESFGSSIAQTK